jgi:hypothetical protein
MIQCHFVRSDRQIAEIQYPSRSKILLTNMFGPAGLAAAEPSAQKVDPKLCADST